MDEIEAANQTLQAVLESIGDGVWVLDGHGETVFANQESADLLQVRRIEQADPKLSDYVEQLTGNGSRPLAPGTCLKQEVAVVTGDYVSWVNLTVIPRFDTHGLPDGHIVMLSTSTQDETPADGEEFAALIDHRIPLDDGEISEVNVGLLSLLSPRERAVTEDLLRGNRVPAIARNFEVSPSTVRNQLSATYRKLGIHSQQELIDLIRGALRNRRSA